MFIAMKLNKSIEKLISELNREEQLLVYEKLQQQLFNKPVPQSPIAFKKLLHGIENNPTIDKIHNYLKNKPVVRAYFFGEFTKHEDTETIDLLLDLEQGVSHFEVLSIQEGLERTLGEKVKLISNRVALIRLPSSSL
jgi:predicted nucleotidyltransferase